MAIKLLKKLGQKAFVCKINFILTILLISFVGCKKDRNTVKKNDIVRADTTISYSNNKTKNKYLRDSIKFESKVNFSDYKVKNEAVNSKINLKSHELGTLFRTKIKYDYENEEMLFAGHYTFSYWGCGSSCQASVLIDRRNGRIYDSPFASIGYEFKNDSRLLIVNPPDSLGYYDKNCSYCKPELYILNEKTKKFEKIENE